MQAMFTAWSGIPGADMSAWEFKPYVQDGQVRAIAALSGFEIHFAIAPEFRHRVIARHRTREFLAPLLEDKGFLTTRTEPDEGRHKFLTRIGFERTWNDGALDHYMLAALPWATTLLGQKPSA